MNAIAPHWAIENLPKLPEAGPQLRNLYRVDGGRRVFVDERVEEYRFYEPDCVIYQTARAGHALFAVCGGRTPIGIASSSVRSWELAADGLRRLRPADVQGGRPVQVVEVLPLQDIIALAGRQPPFRAGWAGTFDVARPPLPPLEQGVPVAAGGIIDATTAHRVDLIEALLRSGADVNARTDFGATPLMIAAGNGDLPVLDYLIAARADVNAQDSSGVTALMRAADVGEKEVVRRLLAAGADSTLRDSEGHTAAERIPMSQDQELLKMLGARR